MYVSVYMCISMSMYTCVCARARATANICTHLNCCLCFSLIFTVVLIISACAPVSTVSRKLSRESLAQALECTLECLCYPQSYANSGVPVLSILVRTAGFQCCLDLTPEFHCCPASCELQDFIVVELSVNSRVPMLSSLMRTPDCLWCQEAHIF